MEQCPCGSGKEYHACCGPLHSGEAQANTAEALMRSRYSAFAKGKIPYILDTVHPDKRSEHNEKEIRSWSANSTWHGLEIVDTKFGLKTDDEGTVEFIAHFTDKNRRLRHHELAQFKKHEDRWYFYDGSAVKPKTVIREAPKVGRNDPCICGSGKKYKKCCGKAS